MLKPGKKRAEALLDLLLPGCRDAGHCSPVERASERQNFKSRFSGSLHRSGTFVAKFPGKFDRGFVRFRTAVRKKDFAGSSGNADESPREFALRTRIIEIGSVNQFARLFLDRLDHPWVRVTKRRDSDPSAEIEVLFSCFIPDACTASANQGHVVSSVIRDDEFFEKLFGADFRRGGCHGKRGESLSQPIAQGQ